MWVLYVFFFTISSEWRVMFFLPQNKYVMRKQLQRISDETSYKIRLKQANTNNMMNTVYKSTVIYMC